MNSLWETANVKITTDVRWWTDNGYPGHRLTFANTHEPKHTIKSQRANCGCPYIHVWGDRPTTNRVNATSPRTIWQISHPNSYPPSSIHDPYRLRVYSPVRPTWRVHHKYILIQMRCFGLGALPVSINLGGTPTNSMGYQHLHLIQQEILNFKNPFTGLWFCNTKINCMDTLYVTKYIYIVYLEE